MLLYSCKRSNIPPLGMLGTESEYSPAFLSHCWTPHPCGWDSLPDTSSPHTHRTIVPIINYINYYSNPYCRNDPSYQPRHHAGGILGRVTHGPRFFKNLSRQWRNTVGFCSRAQPGWLPAALKPITAIAEIIFPFSSCSGWISQLSVQIGARVESWDGGFAVVAALRLSLN